MNRGEQKIVVKGGYSQNSLYIWQNFCAPKFKVEPNLWVVIRATLRSKHLQISRWRQLLWSF